MRQHASSAILFVALLRAPASLVEVLDEAAEAVARDELLALELDARRGRGVVGLEPLLDGAALVRMAVGRVDGVGHDLGGDRAKVVVWHLHCLPRRRRRRRPVDASITANGHYLLQRVDYRRRRCRFLLPFCRRRRRGNGLLTRLGRRRDLHHLQRSSFLHPLRFRQPGRLCSCLLPRLALGRLLPPHLQLILANVPFLRGHASLPHLAWHRHK
mmetsp:Transcript_6471/g.15997  ORF Transcript_6471/g.15997 Transcript_6471/m.15997 type:complete len:214 (-) Transcript_6471:259-900(-)